MTKHTWIALATCLFLMPSAWSQSAGGGAGPGPRMMGGHGMGPGMMGGYGMSPGMMGGYGYGGWGPSIPDLTNEQRTKITSIQKELRQKQWALMGKMHEDAGSGSFFYRDGKIDEQAARKAYDVTANQHKQMFENFLDAQKRIDSLLTPKQREQMQQGWAGR